MSTLKATLQIKHPRPGLVFWLLWYVASFVGWFAIFIPMLVLYLPLWLLGIDPERLKDFGPGVLVVGSILAGAGNGLTIGFAQWLVLRRELTHLSRWVWATVAGYASIGLLLVIGDLVQPGWLTWAATLIMSGKLHWIARVQPEWVGAAWLPGAITLVLFGTVVGAAQWLVLRGRIAWTGWWIAISAAGWAYMAAVSAAPLPWATFVFALDLQLAITGLGMMILLRRKVAVR